MLADAEEIHNLHESPRNECEIDTATSCESDANDNIHASDSNNLLPPKALESVNLNRGPSDLSAIEEPATQPVLGKFLMTIINGKSHSFNSNWYEQYKWIEYSKTRDAIFCKACRHFPELHTEFTFTRDGYKNWKRLRQACNKHESSKPHALALSKIDAYRESHAPQSRGTVLDQLHGDAVSFVERNRQHVKVVLDIVMLCAKLDIPLRGHRESEDALNKGNFLELFKFISKYDNN